MITCECGRGIAGNVAQVMCKCGKLHQLAGAVKTNEATCTTPEFVIYRRGICRSCEHNEGGRCGALLRLGKTPAIIECRKGIHNPDAYCPERKWGVVSRVEYNNFVSDWSDAVNDVDLIAVHFNPTRSVRRRETFYEWAPTLGMLRQRLRVVELVLDDDEPEIDGSIVIRGTRQKHLLWQKEPLLQTMLERSTKRYFAWLDHDIVIERPDWLEDAMRQLRTGCDAVQLFKEVSYLGPDQRLQRIKPGAAANGPGAPGGMWIAKTRFLKNIGGFPLYQIVGSGDEGLLASMRKNGTVGHVNSRSYHLYHGSQKNRQHHERHAMLRTHGFQRSDVFRNDAGILEWANNKELAREVHRFFVNRKEDE